MPEKDENIEVTLEEKEVTKEKKNKQKDKIQSLELEIKALKEEKLRIYAELENFKKRMNQERINDRKYASKNLVAELLQSLDQLNKIVNMPTDNELLKNFLIGFRMINDQLFQVLENDGLKAIDALNKPFDPNYHYAIEKLSNKEQPEGINLEVVQTGYMYKEQLLRPAMVKVNEWSDENGEDK